MAEPSKKATDLSDILGADFDKLITTPTRRPTTSQRRVTATDLGDILGGISLTKNPPAPEKKANIDIHEAKTISQDTVPTINSMPTVKVGSALVEDIKPATVDGEKKLAPINNALLNTSDDLDQGATRIDIPVPDSSLLQELGFSTADDNVEDNDAALAVNNEATVIEMSPFKLEDIIQSAAMDESSSDVDIDSDYEEVVAGDHEAAISKINLEAAAAMPLGVDLTEAPTLEMELESIGSETPTLTMVNSDPLSSERTMDLNISEAIEELPDQDDSTQSNLSQEQAAALMPDLSTLLSEEIETAPTIRDQIDIDSLLNNNVALGDSPVSTPKEAEDPLGGETVKDEAPLEPLNLDDEVTANEDIPIDQSIEPDDNTADDSLDVDIDEDSEIPVDAPAEAAGDNASQPARPDITEGIADNNRPLSAVTEKVDTGTKPQIMPLITEPPKNDIRLIFPILMGLLIIMVCGLYFLYHNEAVKNDLLEKQIATFSTPNVFTDCGKIFLDDTHSSCKTRAELQLTHCLNGCGYNKHPETCSATCRAYSDTCIQKCPEEVIIPPSAVLPEENEEEQVQAGDGQSDKETEEVMALEEAVGEDNADIETEQDTKETVAPTVKNHNSNKEKKAVKGNPKKPAKGAAAGKGKAVKPAAKQKKDVKKRK